MRLLGDSRNLYVRWRKEKRRETLNFKHQLRPYKTGRNSWKVKNKFKANLIKYLNVIEKTGSYACKWALRTEDINPAMSNLLLSDHWNIHSMVDYIWPIHAPFSERLNLSIFFDESWWRAWKIPCFIHTPLTLEKVAQVESIFMLKVLG